eukprot:4127673-Pyramimonas_sp.AAC.1
MLRPSGFLSLPYPQPPLIPIGVVNAEALPELMFYLSHSPPGYDLGGTDVAAAAQMSAASVVPAP